MTGAQWLKGTVKEVLSGDTVVIAAPSRGNAPPPEKRLSLASLVTPKLGRRDGSTMDEPFAFSSKEFLRRMVIGKACVFRVEYKIDAANGREFGSVFVGEENVALCSVAAGMVGIELWRSEAPRRYSLVACRLLLVACRDYYSP